MKLNYKKLNDNLLIFFKQGGGLSRKYDYKSKEKPYPSVQQKDFAGNNRSYPIPTKADAIDALRLAGLHGRNDVKSKVYKKYPELKKHQQGGEVMFKNNPVDTSGYYNKSVKLLNKYKYLNMANRALNAQNKNALITPFNETHQMSYYTNDQGDNFAIPLVVQEKNKNSLTRFFINPNSPSSKTNKPNWRKAQQYAEKTGEKIPLGKDIKFAEYFTSPGYKYNFNKDVHDQALKDYSKYTNIQVNDSPLKIEPKQYQLFNQKSQSKPLYNPFNDNPNKYLSNHRSEFINYWKSVENNIDLGKKGDKWYPHASYEGGHPTIAYGLKLGINPEFDKLAKQGLTEQQVEDELNNRINSSLKSIEHFYDNKYGKGSFNKLPDKNKYAMVEIQMNTGGIKKFPSFVEALKNNNINLAVNESIRSANGKPLTSRNEAFAKYLKQ